MAKATEPKWTFLEHNGPLFTPDYVPLEKDTFEYNGNIMTLSAPAEEAAGFYAQHLYHKYTKIDRFNENFFSDWRELMEESEREDIKEFKLCNFTKMNDYLINKQKEQYKLTKEEKKQREEEQEAIIQVYGYCNVKYSADGEIKQEKIHRFTVEKPGILMANHASKGKLKKRIRPEDVTINCSKDSVWPEPPFGNWKGVQHDNTVSWLACWRSPLLNKIKYIELDASSQLKMETDCQKYETARKLGGCINKIREEYRKDWEENNKPIVQQTAVAIYLIDKLAFRAGYEDSNREVDTVGCCSLQIEHVNLHEKMGELEYVAEFNFPGKKNVPYHNIVPIEKRVYQIIHNLKNHKEEGEKLFHNISPYYVNLYLAKWGVTMKVFRTYNASITMQEQLQTLTVQGDTEDKVKAFKDANLLVGTLCNHRSSKHTGKNVTLVKNAEDFIDEVEESRGEESTRFTSTTETEVSSVSSKHSYIDPRIVVAWCLNNDVEPRDIYSEEEMEQFSWAINWEDVKIFVF